MLEGTGSALCLSFAARPAWRTRHVPLRLAPLTPKAAERVRLGRRRARSSCDLPAPPLPLPLLGWPGAAAPCALTSGCAALLHRCLPRLSQPPPAVASPRAADAAAACRASRAGHGSCFPPSRLPAPWMSGAPGRLSCRQGCNFERLACPQQAHTTAQDCSERSSSRPPRAAFNSVAWASASRHPAASERRPLPPRRRKRGMACSARC